MAATVVDSLCDNSLPGAQRRAFETYSGLNITDATSRATMVDDFADDKFAPTSNNDDDDGEEFEAKHSRARFGFTTQPSTYEGDIVQHRDPRAANAKLRNRFDAASGVVHRDPKLSATTIRSSNANQPEKGAICP